MYLHMYVDADHAASVQRQNKDKEISCTLEKRSEISKEGVREEVGTKGLNELDEQNYGRTDP